MAVFVKERLPKKPKQEETAKKPTIMIVDDEKPQIDSMMSLLSEDYHIITAGDGSEALERIQGMEQPENISLIISDKRMPRLNGIQLCEKLKEIIPNTIRIILTAFDDKEDIIEAINKAKIHEFILKTYEPEDLKIRVKRAVETFELKKAVDEYRRQLEQTVEKRTEELKDTRAYLQQTKKEAERLRESLMSSLKYREYFKDNIITNSIEIIGIFKHIETVSQFNVPVLITGETGTGKELIAKAIHKIYISENKKKDQFLAVNIAAANAELISDELFGHKKGAFSDAQDERSGLLEEAEEGTLFLDEIGALDLPLQKKLLRVLEDKKYFKIGVDKPKDVTARLVFATNEDPDILENEGKFRKDLLYRLEKHHIHLPPLRERKEDIGPLVEYFIKKEEKVYNKSIPGVPAQLIALLSHYDFPGNVRELLNMVSAAVVAHNPGDKELSLVSFVEHIKKKKGKIDFSLPENLNPSGKAESEVIFIGTLPIFEDMKKIYTKEAMKRTGNNQTKAARLAGLDRATFIRYWKGPEKKNEGD